MRLHASGVCHSDWNAIDGTAETPCPAVLGHEGAGVVEAVGAGVTRVASATTSHSRGRRGAASARNAVRDLPAALLHGLAGDGNGRADGRHDAPLARRRGRLPLLVPLDVRRGVRRPRALVHPDPGGRPVRRRRARRLRRDDRGRRRLANRGRAAGRPRRGDRLRRRRALGAHGRRRGGRRSGDRSRRGRREARRRAGRSARSSGVLWQGSAEDDRRGGAARHPAAASTTRSRRPDGRRRWKRRSSRRAPAEPRCSSASRVRTRCCPYRR